DLLRLRQRRELVEARVRHGDLADIRLDRAERIVRRLRRRRLRQRVEKGRLADIGQTDDATLESNQLLSFVFAFAGSGLASALSPKPLASIARCTLFWNVASWPFASSGALSAIASHSAATQSRSLLAKSCST